MQADFNTTNHTIALSNDGSYTAFSKEYDEHYHSTQDGALSESLFKHIQPALKLMQAKKELFILDICYGLGFNTLATLYYVQKHNLNIKLHIYSPELDEELIDSLENFQYPQEFSIFAEIIKKVSKDHIYEDENFYIELFLGDAREYVKRFDKKFDIVYQDAFSPSTNPILWTKEYFSDISRAMKDDGVVTTYSMALKTRLALYENGFKLYINQGEGYRDATLASKKLLLEYKKVDMEHKIACNPAVKPLSDSELT
jgi:tRNA U34 5-methylaminomethyl-2-thiouridine-forming methyltransferase MnmC